MQGESVFDEVKRARQKHAKSKKSYEEEAREFAEFIKQNNCKVKRD